MQAKIKSIEIKGDWANIILEDGDYADKKLSGNLKFNDKFATLKQGDVINFTVKDDKWINLDKEKKAGGFPQKDYSYEKKRVALECAVSFNTGTGGKLKTSEVIQVAEKFHEFLK